MASKRQTTMAKLERERAVRERRARTLAFLRKQVWPTVPKDQRGKRLSREEEDEILGYGPEGA